MLTSCPTADNHRAWTKGCAGHENAKAIAKRQMGVQENRWRSRADAHSETITVAKISAKMTLT